MLKWRIRWATLSACWWLGHCWFRSGHLQKHGTAARRLLRSHTRRLTCYYTIFARRLSCFYPLWPLICLRLCASVTVSLSVCHMLVDLLYRNGRTDPSSSCFCGISPEASFNLSCCKEIVISPKTRVNSSGFNEGWGPEVNVWNSRFKEAFSCWCKLIKTETAKYWRVKHWRTYAYTDLCFVDFCCWQNLQLLMALR